MNITTQKLIVRRIDAKRMFLKHFYTGVPCIRGHYAQRYVSTGACLDCQKHNYRYGTPTVRAGNRFVPLRPLTFRTDATTIEAMTAFLYIELNGWHNAAIDALRANPELAERLRNEITELRWSDAGVYPRAVKSPT